MEGSPRAPRAPSAAAGSRSGPWALLAPPGLARAEEAARLRGGPEELRGRMEEGGPEEVRRIQAETGRR
eukprot:7074348-Pyramimonas_sp.AAC.1